MRRLRLAALVAATLTSPVLLAPAASAQSVYTGDSVHDVADVMSQSQRFPSNETDHDEGDIVRTRLWHSETRVGIKVVFTRLSRDVVAHVGVLDIRTDAHLRRTALLTAEPGRWRGDVELFGSLAFAELRCPVGHTIDYAADTLTLGVPRSCLGDPRWVRMGYTHLTAPAATASSGMAVFADDAFSESIDQEAMTALSGRVLR